ncbi:hypothetical protein FB446DRAFT_704552 [Lentinula raphanica]|nr:hypothetical protein FB446DRAFT_704552 [Lentinula raphanica]
MALPSPVGRVERCGSSESPGSASCSRSPSLSIRRSAVTPKGYIQSHGTRPDARDIQNEDKNTLLEETWAVCFETDCITSGIDSRHRNPDLRSVPSVQFFKNSVLTHHGHPSTRSLGAKVDWGTEDNRQAYYRRFKALPGKETLPLLNSILRILVDDHMLYTESATGKQVLKDLPSDAESFQAGAESFQAESFQAESFQAESFRIILFVDPPYRVYAVDPGVDY